MNDGHLTTEILIVGAGVAGSSLAIRLRKQGLEVIVADKDMFPRHKLCGEFVSPECVSHFNDLGVIDSIRDIGGDSIFETRFFSVSGKQLNVPSEWFSNGKSGALGISRAEMDLCMLNRAKEAGAKVYEGWRVVAIDENKKNIRAVELKNGSGERFSIGASLVVDATGRSRVMGRLVEKRNNSADRNRKVKLIAFKAHYQNVTLDKGVCEIYFFKGGYGGLNYVEDGAANHCFIIDSKLARKFRGNPDQILENVVFRNERVAKALRNAERKFAWIAVPIEKFGRQRAGEIENLISIGDAKAFIDPFTGSGMLMALESSEMLAGVIADKSLNTWKEKKVRFDVIHRHETGKRLKLCSIIRRLSLAPRLADIVISTAGISRVFLSHIVSLTRPARNP